jgi:hypothetical protein
MSYFIYRNEQQYGPYTLQDLQSQVAGGTMVAADQARSAQGGPWTTVGDILAQTSQGLVPPSAPAHPGAVTANAVPLPPNLHWAIVLVIGLVFNPFTLGWRIYELIWVRNIDKESKALLYYGLAIGTFLIGIVIGIAIVVQNTNNPSPWCAVPFSLGALSMFVFTILAKFDFRRSMLAYYNTVEPIGLRMSGILTFFFPTYYFQHHLSRIATWKLTGHLAPQG